MSTNLIPDKWALPKTAKNTIINKKPAKYLQNETMDLSSSLIIDFLSKIFPKPRITIDARIKRSPISLFHKSVGSTFEKYTKIMPKAQAEINRNFLGSIPRLKNNTPKRIAEMGKPT